MKLFVVALLLFSQIIHAGENTYEREYTYTASELDSKVSARKHALEQVKSLLLEEIATYVYSSNSSTQSLGADYQKQFVQNIKNISAGFLGATILQEKWDGRIFWLRAELRADPAKIMDELKKAINSPPPVNAEPTMDVATTTPVYRGYTQQAQLASAINLVMPIKMQLLEYYQMMGTWPNKFDELGLKPSDLSDGNLLEQVKLGKNGEMILNLSQKFGEKKYLSMKPELIMGGMNMKWTCKTNLPRTEVPMSMACEIIP